MIGVTNPGGTLVDTIVYTGFGVIASETAPGPGGNILYAGMWYDRNTGLSRTPNRAYASATGDWTTTDPIGFSGGSSDLYSYVGNNATDTTDPSGQFALMDLLGHPNGGWFNQLSNFSAGFADTITGGGTQWVRIALDYNDAVDQTSWAYAGGGYAGQAVNIGLMFANPLALSSGFNWALKGINYASQASGFLSAGMQAMQGNYWAMGMSLASMAPLALRGAGSGCAANLLERGVQLVGIGQGIYAGAERFADGDYLGGALHLASAGVSAYRFMQSCFAAGTKLLTRRGWVAIESIEVGDEVWSRPEDNPEAMGEWKRVEELFVRTAVILEVRVGGQVIETTAEHPFYVREKGWLAAGFVEAGDRVHGKDGEWTTVEDVAETQRVATVYNMRVADFHTYFVGGEDWGFSVWAHNAFCEFDIDRYGNFNSKENAHDDLAGHELLQNAWLKANGQATKRGTGSASRNNPAMALGDEIHKAVGAEQQTLGLFNAANLKTQSAIDNIALNAEAMVNSGRVPITCIQNLAAQAVQHGQNLGVVPTGSNALQQVNNSINSAWMLRDNICW